MKVVQTGIKEMLLIPMEILYFDCLGMSRIDDSSIFTQDWFKLIKNSVYGTAVPVLEVIVGI